MIAYYKDRKTFETLLAVNVISYDDVPIASVYDDAGSIVVEGNSITYGMERGWLVINSSLLFIASISPGVGQTEIIVTTPLEAFSRSLFYDGSEITAPARIEAAFRDNYKMVGDVEFAMPYLVINNTSTTDNVFAPDTESKLWSLKSFIRKTERLTDCVVRFDIGVETLTVNIEDRVKPIRTVIKGDGHHQITEETYGPNTVSKVTAVTEAGDAYDWYMDTDGNISNTVPSNRAEGDWEVIPAEEDDILSSVQDAFSTSSASHKIEFYSENRYNLRDNVRIRTDNAVLFSYICYVGISSSDNRYHYKTGELSTTLVEKIRDLQMKPPEITKTSQLENDAGYVNEVGAAAAAPVQSVNGKTGTVTRSQLGCLSVDGDVPSIWSGSSYDLNNFFSGVVLCYSNVQHVPSADWWHVMASGTSGTVVQIAAKLQNNGAIMTRRCAGGTWSAWEPISDNSYKAGETLTLSASTFAGHFRTGATYFEFTVPVQKSLESITSISCTTLTGWMLGVNGDCESSTSSGYKNWKTTSYTVTATKRGNSMISVLIQKSSAFTNATNLTPGVFFCGSIVFSFS